MAATSLPGPGTVKACSLGCDDIVRLSEIRDEIWDLAERDPLTVDQERRWQQLVPHWIALADRVLKDQN